MAGIYGYSREAVRVKVKKCEQNLPPEWRKFSVDPQITSLEVLYSILAKAFDIKSDFSVSYRSVDSLGQETYLGVLSDWELEAAFLRAHNLSVQSGNEPCLNLRVDVKAFSEATDWEVNSPAASTKEISSLQQSIGVGQKYVQNMQNKLPGLIINQMEKTFSMVQRALNLAEEQVSAQPPRPPLSDVEFRKFLDSVGQILRPEELRRVIFLGGIDPSLRKVVWKHILNVYPKGMTGKERMDYMKKKAFEYYRLRDIWRVAVQKGPVIGELAYVTSMVRKDVLRTDRLHPFYAGSDDNQNIASLFNILTTYALNHPSVSYCQGMSDIASPLLVTMGDEAHAYICFCAVMSRLKSNFMLDGISMTQKFTHLAEALQFYDPEFYEYLKAQQADDLLFCYRWLLLEMKREFPFEDSLRMLEVLWSSLRYDPPTMELNLFEKEFEPPPIDNPPPKSPSSVLKTPRENHYTKVCALRRQSSSVSLLSNSPNQSSCYNLSKLDITKRLNQSLDENISRSTARAKSIIKPHQSLDETKMTMLMRNTSLKEILTTVPKNDLDEENDEFIKYEGPDDNENTFSFHPTNPFLDDAKEEIENMEKKNEPNSNLLSNETKSKTISKNNKDSKSLSPKRDQKQIGSKGQKTSLKQVNKNTFTYNASNLTKQLSIRKGGHFKELKEKIVVASRKGILASLEKMENTENPEVNPTVQSSQENPESFIHSSTRGQKVVKNFNEFLNFAAINKSKISDKLTPGNKIFDKKDTGKSQENAMKSSMRQQRPLIKLTRNSFEDSDSSTLDTSTSTGKVIASNNSQQSEENHPKPLQLQLTNIVAQTQQNLEGNSPDDGQEYYPMTTPITREVRLELENLDRQVFGEAGIIRRNKFLSDSEIGYEKLGKETLDLVEVNEEEIVACPDVNDIVVLRNSERRNLDYLKRISTSSANTDIFFWENPLHQISGASSCNNFNDMGESVGDEYAIRSATNEVGSADLDGTVQCTTISAMTPDEQQDLEYDGDIILEYTEDDTRKSLTPLRLIQPKSSSNSKIRDDSDSENTENSFKQTQISNPNLNPFLQSFSASTSSNNTILPGNELIGNIFGRKQDQEVGNQISIENELYENAQKNEEDIQQQCDPELGNFEGVSQRNPQLVEEASEVNTNFSKITNILPSPKDFGGGNPFLIFLCLTLLLQHRNVIIKSGMDYNEMAMHFDKMVRKHEVTRVLNQARRMYFEYLKTQNSIRNAKAKSNNRNQGGNQEQSMISS